jgi:hypothetical protein
MPLSRLLMIWLMMVLPAAVWAADIDRFVGVYEGHTEFVQNDETQSRDLSTTIAPTKTGFALSWTSVTYRSDGRIKEKNYKIEFVPSPRAGIFGSAMKTNVFGKPEPLDPLNGEPFVWTRIARDTFSTFSLFINEAGEYEMQEYHRTLADGGLDLVFRRVRNGAIEREIKAFLKRQD